MNSPNLIIHNANIWTADISNPQAEAMAVINDKILSAGSNSEVLKLKNNKTEIINAEGQFITPGFIDSHVHFLTGGYNLSSIQLKDANSPEEFIRIIKSYVSGIKPGEWILEGSWDHENWGGQLPERSWIDSFTQNNPVFIRRSDIHTGLANEAALKFAGIDRYIKDIKGGTIVRDSNGELTGILKDNAMNLIFDRMPAYTTRQTNKALTSATNYFASNGISTVHNMGSIEDIEIFEEAVRNKSLKTRIYAVSPLPLFPRILEKVKVFERNDWLKIGCVKLFSDGSLGSKTAAFFEQYIDSPGNYGLFVDSKENFLNGVIEADKANLNIVFHAIGDKANNMVLDIYENTINTNGKRDRRFRIEHAQHLIDNDINRFSKSGIIASMQPSQLPDDARWAEKTIGEKRTQNTFAFQSLLNKGTCLAFGSDWPVVSASPIKGISAAVTRESLDGKNPEGWIPEQRISVGDALKAYTINAAYASFDENIKGSIEPGKLADFVILDRDITKIPAKEIKETRVINTYVGGELVFSAG